MIAYYANAKKGAPQLLSNYEAGSWALVENPSDKEVQLLCNKFGLNEQFVKQVLDDNAIPHVEKSDGFYYFYVRFPLEIDDKLTTAPMLIIASKEYFITVTKYHSLPCEKLIKTGSTYAMSSQGELGLAIFNEIIKQYGAYINQIGSHIEGIRSRLKGQTISDKDFVDFVLIEGELNEFTTVMRSTAASLNNIARIERRKEYGINEEAAQDIIANNQQSIDDCELYAKSIASIRDAYSTINSNSLNKTMKFLTIATLFAALPNCIFGMYGMNVALPLQDKKWVFLFLLGIGLLIPIGIMYVAKKKKLL